MVILMKYFCLAKSKQKHLFMCSFFSSSEPYMSSTKVYWQYISIKVLSKGQIYIFKKYIYENIILKQKYEENRLENDFHPVQWTLIQYLHGEQLNTLLVVSFFRLISPKVIY